MKTVFTSAELPHIWAHKSAPFGKSPSALSFDGPVIRSYQTTMARHIEHKGKAAVILNDTSYSVTTSGHQHQIRMAIPSDVMLFRVTGQRRGTDLRFTGQELFNHYLECAARAEQDALLPRIKQSTRDGHKGRAAAFLEQAQAVAAFYGLRRKVDSKAVERLAAAKARAERAAQKAQEKRDALERRAQENQYEAWKMGADVLGFNARLFPVAFRIESRDSGEAELVSTLGARVPLAAARLAFRFALSKRAKGAYWRENGETCTVGNYRLNAINAQGIVAGCHRITWAEIERLAPILSGETVNA